MRDSQSASSCFGSLAMAFVVVSLCCILCEGGTKTKTRATLSSTASTSGSDSDEGSLSRTVSSVQSVSDSVSISPSRASMTTSASRLDSISISPSSASPSRSATQAVSATTSQSTAPSVSPTDSITTYHLSPTSSASGSLSQQTRSPSENQSPSASSRFSSSSSSSPSTTMSALDDSLSNTHSTSPSLSMSPSQSISRRTMSKTDSPDDTQSKSWTRSSSHSMPTPSGSFSVSPAGGSISSSQSPSVSRTDMLSSSVTASETGTHSNSESASDTSPSSSLTGSSSHGRVAPWIRSLNGQSPAISNEVLLPAQSTSSFTATVQTTDGSSITRTLTVQPTPLGATSNPFQLHCGVGLPTVPSTSMSASGASASTVSLVLDYTTFLPLVNVSQGNDTFVLCTSDGYFAGVIVRLSSALQWNVSFPRSVVTLPGTSGQFSSWSLRRRVYVGVTNTYFSSRVAGASVSRSDVIFAVDDDVAAASSCSYGDRVASFAVTFLNNTNVLLVISSTDVATVSASVVTLRMCFGGSPGLGLRIQMIRSLRVNNMIISTSSPLSLVAATKSTISPITVTSLAAGSSGLSGTSLAMCDSSTAGATVSSSPQGTSNTYRISLDVTAAVTSLVVCLRMTDVTELDGLLSIMTVEIIGVTAMDAVAAGTVASPSALGLFIGRSGLTLSTSFSRVLGTSISTAMNIVNVFLASSNDVESLDTFTSAVPSVTTFATTSASSTASLVIPQAWIASGGNISLFVAWSSTFSGAATPAVNVALMTMDVTVVAITWVGRSLSMARSLVLSGETNVALSVNSTPSLSALPLALQDVYIGYLNAASTACTQLSAWSSAVASSASFSPGLVWSGALVQEGVFCVGRSSQGSFVAPSNTLVRFTVGSLTEIGNATNVLQLVQPTTLSIGLAESTVLATTSGMDTQDVAQITLLPCTQSDTAFIQVQLVTGLGTFSVAAKWKTNVTTSVSSVVSLCWAHTDTSLQTSPSDYYTLNLLLPLPQGISVLVLPPLTPNVSDIPLFGGVSGQRVSLTFSSSFSTAVYGTAISLAVGIAPQGGVCNTTSLAVSSLFVAAVATPTTTVTVVFPTQNLHMEPVGQICFGVVNATSGYNASGTYALLSASVSLALFLRYTISGPVGTSLSIIPTTTPSTVPTLVLYNFFTATVNLAATSPSSAALLSSTSATSHLNLTLGVSLSSSCSSIAFVLGEWQQGSSTSGTPFVGLSSLASDSYFLCVKLSSDAPLIPQYTFAVVSLKVIRFTSFDTSLTPDGFMSQVDLTAATSSLLQSLVMFSASARTITVAGQHLDESSAWSLNLYQAAGVDCTDGSISPDRQAPASLITSTSLIYTIPAIASATTFETICVVGTVGVTTLTIFLHFGIRVTSIVSIGILASQRQKSIIAVSGFSLPLPLFDASGPTTLDITTFELHASNASSCGRGQTASEQYAAFYPLPLSNADGHTSVALGGLSSSGTYYLCFRWTGGSSFSRHWTSLTTTGMSPTGVTITTIDLRIQTFALGSNKTIGSLVNSTLDLKADGTYLSSATVYVSATDTLCNASLNGTTVYGNPRTPTVFSGCSATSATATLQAAPLTTGSGSMRLCLGFIPSTDTTTTVNSVTFVDSGLKLAVAQPDELYIVQNQSSTASYLGTVGQQPIVGMRDGVTKVSLALLPTATVLQAEWLAVSPIIEQTGQRYTLTSASGDSAFDYSSNVAGQIALKNGKFGFKYVLSFTVPASSTVGSVRSSETSVTSCASTSQWAQWYTSTCTTCPSHGTCDGTSSFVTSGSYWRGSNYSINFYSCSSPYMRDTCQSNTSTGTCIEGHTGPRCSVCLPGYGLASDFCVTCAGNEIANAFVVLFAALAMVLVVVVLVVSTLQCKKSDQFPIYIKLLLNHLTVSSTLGEFSQYLSSSMITLFKIQRQASRPSPAFAALSCSLNLSWYNEFVIVNAFPFATAFLLIGFFVSRKIYTMGQRYWNSRHRRSNAAIASPFKSKTMRAMGSLAFVVRRQSIANSDQALQEESKRKSLAIDLGVSHKSEVSVDVDPSGGFTPNKLGSLEPSRDDSKVVFRRRVPKVRMADDPFPPRASREDSLSAHVDAGHVEGAAQHEDEEAGQHDGPREQASRSPKLDADVHGGGERINSGGSSKSASDVVVNIDQSQQSSALMISQSAAFSDAEDKQDKEEEGEEGEGDIEDEDTAAAQWKANEAEDPKQRRMTESLGLLEVHGSVARQEAIHLFAVVMVIVMFAAYPSIIEWCAEVLRCDDMDIGEAQVDGTIAVNVQSYFFYDRSKLCTSEEHRRYIQAGIGLGMAYGFGTPLIAVLLYYRFKRPRSHGGVGYVDASRMFTFLIAGYRREVWWWEAAVMFRKLLLIYIVSFIRDQQQQTLCAFWAICLYFIAHVMVQPYEYDTADRMETYSLAVICLTLNFSVAYTWLQGTDIGSQIGYWALSVFLLVINSWIVLWILKEILVEGTVKLQKWLYANDELVSEFFHPAIAQCLLRFAYKPPEVVEVTAEGQVVEVPVNKVAGHEQQAFIDAEESGSDWSDDDASTDFHLDNSDVHEMEAGLNTSAGEGAAAATAAGQAPPPITLEGSGPFARDEAQHIGGVRDLSTSQSGTWSRVRNRLKSLTAITSGTGFSRNQSEEQITAAARTALCQAEQATAARTNNMVGHLRAVIDGLQEHSDTLIGKYTDLKELLHKREEELAVMRLRNSDHENLVAAFEAQIRAHVSRLTEMQSMAESLREENEDLKTELSRLTSYDRSLSPTSNNNLVEVLARERRELLQRLAQHEMEHGNAVELPKAAIHHSEQEHMDATMRTLAQEAEIVDARAKALAQAEREEQLNVIEAQIKAKREAKQRRLESSGLGVAPGASGMGVPLSLVRRASRVDALVDRITTDDTPRGEEAANPLQRTLPPAGSLQSALRMFDDMMREGGPRPGTAERPMSAALSSGQPPGAGLGVSVDRSDMNLADCFPDEQFTAVQTDDDGRVLVIRRRHPKKRPEQFVAPWGHATWVPKVPHAKKSISS